MSASPRNSLPRSVRVRTRAEFDRAFQDSQRVSDRWVIVRVVPNAGAPARLGIAVSKRFGNAVHRNRIKRLIREAFRTIRHQLPAELDVVVMPRPQIEPTVDELRASLLHLVARATSKR